MVSIISALHSTLAAVLSDPHPEVNNFAKIKHLQQCKKWVCLENWRKLEVSLKTITPVLDCTIYQGNILIIGKKVVKLRNEQ